MARKQRATILHLSDLQFGCNHRFSRPIEGGVWGRYASPAAFKTLFVKLENDLLLLKQQEGLQVNVLIISGDIAEWSTTDEYEQAKIFIDSLIQSKATSLSRERVILIPGNHDVNWDLSQSYFFKCKAYRREPELPFWEKFGFWQEFMHGSTERVATAEEPWIGYDLKACGVVIVALNSALQESHLDKDHYGWVGLPQVSNAVRWIEDVDPHRKLPRIAVIHHNILRGSGADEENLRDWDEVRPLFEKHVDILLHGHRHQGERTRLGQLDGHLLLILGAGSAGLDSATLPSCPNQYQIISLEGRTGTVFLRKFADERTGEAGSGQFIPDVDAEGRWQYKISIPSPHKPPTRLLGRRRKKLGAKDSDFAPYVSFAEETISRRLLNEEQKVDHLLDLHCKNIRDRKENSLIPEISSWLNGNCPHAVILGAAGSGKTIACLSVARMCLKDAQWQNWIPIYLDLGRYASLDGALEILREHFRANGCLVEKDAIKRFLDSHQVLVILDAFDEYDKSGAVSASDRSFEDFATLVRPNIKLVVTCRTNFFRRPDDIFLYDLRGDSFELCPGNSLVIEILPLDTAEIRGAIAKYSIDGELPEWVLNLADRPLYLRMLVVLLQAREISLLEKIKRPELYERFVDYGLKWDVIRRSSAQVTLDQSRDFHTKLAQRMLDRGATSLDDIELFAVIEDQFLHQNTRSEEYRNLVFFFKESGLLRFESGRLDFVHKSFREYLIARKIYQDIVLKNNKFDFIWFTRNERDFIVEMLNDTSKATLYQWLKQDTPYPASNYAAFILGGTGDQQMREPLRNRLNEATDPLLRTNILTSLAALGDVRVMSMLEAVVAGYAMDEGLATIPPAGIDYNLLGSCRHLLANYGRYVMLIHLCESIDALARIGDEKAVNLLSLLERAPDKSVGEEAKLGVWRLVDRLKIVKIR